jgi:hypothetical protein
MIAQLSILIGYGDGDDDGSPVACRYAFRRHFFQHAGFRYIVSDAPVTMPPNAEPYETDR